MVMYSWHKTGKSFLSVLQRRRGPIPLLSPRSSPMVLRKQVSQHRAWYFLIPLPLSVLLDICSPNSIMQHILRELFCLQGWWHGSLGKALPHKPNYLRLSPRIHRQVGHRHSVLYEHHTHAAHTIVTKLLIKSSSNSLRTICETSAFSLSLGRAVLIADTHLQLTYLPWSVASICKINHNLVYSTHEGSFVVSPHDRR